ncbi:MAG: OPT/YSL family transporter [Streptococcaceae bacterium]|nr:OPT/YSL family transporter [Streptococcaceae bacterium]
MKKLSKDAYGGVPGKDYVPYENGRKTNAGSPLVLVIGTILAVIFAASTAYSGMKAGLTVAAGIPGAILGSGILSIFIRKNTFLKKNILQSMASGGESIASGIIFVLPAIILIGGKVNFIQGILVGVAAVFFGIGILTFVQDYLLVEEHGKLMYPESMAISESLVALNGTGGSSLKYMGIGFGIGGVITALTTSVFGVLNNVIDYVNESFYKWKFSMEVNPMLAAIGFIVGTDVSIMMFAGSILASMAVVPLIGYFSIMAQDGFQVWNAASVHISAMQVADIAGSYVKYIGAGMMISGGIIGAIKLIPTIVNSVKATLAGRKNAEAGDRDSVGVIALIIGVILTFVFGFVISGNPAIALLAGIIALVLALLFVIVSGRLTGTIGTSNLPVSGMTIAALVILTLVFLMMGWTSNHDIQTLLLFGTFIVVSISVAGGYTQSQKVTFIVGGRPSEIRKYYLLAGTIGVIIVVGVIGLLSGQLAITGANTPFALPQANLMATLTSGIIQGNLPWHMIIVGIVFGIVLYMMGVSVMTFAIGFYLPISTTSIILVGALLRVLVEMISNKKAKEVKNERLSAGVSLSSGLIAGASIIGLIGIILQVTGVIKVGTPTGFMSGNAIAWILLAILIIAILLPILMINKAPKSEDEDA